MWRREIEMKRYQVTLSIITPMYATLVLSADTKEQAESMALAALKDPLEFEPIEPMDNRDAEIVMVEEL